MQHAKDTYSGCGHHFHRLPGSGGEQGVRNYDSEGRATCGTTDKKHKKQQYDLTFMTSTNEYTCRTNENEKVEATTTSWEARITYKIDGNKGEVKNAERQEREMHAGAGGGSYSISAVR